MEDMSSSEALSILINMPELLEIDPRSKEGKAVLKAMRCIEAAIKAGQMLKEEKLTEEASSILKELFKEYNNGD